MAETENKVDALRKELGLSGTVAIPSVDHAKKELAVMTQNKSDLESQKSQEAFPKGHILNSNALDVIGQLEALDANGEFSSELYQSFLNSQAKNGEMSVEANQKKLQEIIDKGKQPEDYDYTDSVIYGIGGMNRYGADENGMLTLKRGSSVTSGSDSYKAALETKARESGINLT